MQGGGYIKNIFTLESDSLGETMDAIKCYPEFEIFCPKDEAMVSLPGLEIDLARRRVYCRGKEINLTRKEYALLCLFAANEGYVLSYEQIYRKVWGEEGIGNEKNAIKCHIHNLRIKLYSIDPDAPFLIRCVREVGYCFEIDFGEMNIT